MMRTTPRVGTKVWFAPRRVGGWGWEPASVEGWLVVIVTIVVVLVAVRWAEEAPGLVIAISIIAPVLGIVACLLKGTSPGGRAAHAEYLRLRDERQP